VNEPDTPWLYAGPTAAALTPAQRAQAGVRWQPPVRRGDIDRLVDDTAAAGHPPGTVIVCDGVFHAAPAVSHAELCRALDAGWAVWGVSSLGAIRAWELRIEGMRGFGDVHARFARHDDFTDDELCLLHLPGPTWAPLSEALVNVRDALEREVDRGRLGAPAADAVVEALQALWFGDRTLERLHACMTREAGVDDVIAASVIASLSRDPSKTRDLVRLLAERPWQVPFRAPRTP
jgi:hypothetical protein